MKLKSTIKQCRAEKLSLIGNYAHDAILAHCMQQAIEHIHGPLKTKLLTVVAELARSFGLIED
jgi:hypothetical protein